jgi:hypothetical protein
MSQKVAVKDCLVRIIGTATNWVSAQISITPQKKETTAFLFILRREENPCPANVATPQSKQAAKTGRHNILNINAFPSTPQKGDT